MIQRDILKKIVKFGKKEFNEKRPLSLQVLRIKSKSILKRGMLPNLNIKQIQGIFFLVVLDYKEYLRIYFFNRNGELTGGENFRKSSDLIKKISKETSLEYKLPKSKPTITISDITSHYKEYFTKNLQKMNHLFAMQVKLPPIIAREDIKLEMGRMIGIRRDKKMNALLISKEAYKKDIFEIIVIRELMFLFLRDLIVMNQDIEEEIVLWYDLALLFANFYLKNIKNESVSSIIKNSTNCSLNLENGEIYDFSSKILGILNKNRELYKTKEVNILFRNIFNCLKILKNYGIKLRYKEFSNLFFALCDIFSGKDNEYHSNLLKFNYNLFHYNHFKKTLEKDKNSKKDQFLVILFSFLTDSEIEIKSIYEISNIINDYTNILQIQKEILNLKKFINEAFVEYVFNKFIEIKSDYEIKENQMQYFLSIKNKSNFIFQNFFFAISWKPKNRINQISAEGLVKSRDLHNILQSKYSFSIENKGNINFYIRIEFLNPLNTNTILKKIIKNPKINLLKKT